MATLIGVRPRAAPILLEKHPQPFLGARKVVLGVQRPQNLVLAHQLVYSRSDMSNSGDSELHSRAHRCGLDAGPRMRQTAQRRYPNHCGAAAGHDARATGATRSRVDTVDASPPVLHDAGSIWNR